MINHDKPGELNFTIARSLRKIFYVFLAETWPQQLRSVIPCFQAVFHLWCLGLLHCNTPWNIDLPPSSWRSPVGISGPCCWIWCCKLRIHSSIVLEQKLKLCRNSEDHYSRKYWHKKQTFEAAGRTLLEPQPSHSYSENSSSSEK